MHARLSIPAALVSWSVLATSCLTPKGGMAALLFTRRPLPA
jgi:hypothetical protein